MKIIIAGATGYIGQELLSQCLAQNSITAVVALTRRGLPLTNPKLRTYIMEDKDWLSYSDPDLKAELAGSQACLWTIGLTPSKAGKVDEVTAKRVSVEYPAAAVGAFQRAFLAGDGDGEREGDGDGQRKDKRKFRFVYISGAAAERDQNRSLWYWRDYRRLRGESENVLLRHSEANKDLFETYIMRPGPVPTDQGALKNYLWEMVSSVRLDLLVKTIDVALNGQPETTLSVQAIRGWAGK
ncbi:putative nucleoside-diphosphate-sugar epimerase [Aspergillus undulatus]|uniref:putative nucleoside-diphosphate-sugar epimerase n=1 Tax=Aspergillus undulatus TaxID=1810928 RepID=UPI003CCD700D